jgi:hypothetical protein
MTSHFTTTLPLLVALALGCTPHSTIDPSPDAGSPFDGGADDGGADGGSPDLRGGRFPDRSLARFLRAAPHDRWWIEERLAPQPRVAGDFDLGPRAIVRNVGDVRVTVWAPPETERLVDACVRADDTWSGVGIGADRQVFVAHGDRDGLVRRATLEDPSLRDEPLAWLNGPRDALRVSPLSEASPKIVCDGADTVVSLMSEDFAVLAYRLCGSAAPQRTLVAPATAVTPFLPIGGSYDDFDAMVAPYVTHLALAPSGRVFVAWLADRTRVLRYNAAFGTELDLVREQLYPRQGDGSRWSPRASRSSPRGRTRGRTWCTCRRMRPSRSRSSSTTPSATSRSATGAARRSRASRCRRASARSVSARRTRSRAGASSWTSRAPASRGWSPAATSRAIPRRRARSRSSGSTSTRGP